MTNDIFGECDCSVCNENTFLQEQEETLLNEIEELVKMRDNLNMANLLEEGKPELGENEFSRESRKIRLGMMRSCMVKTMQYSYDFQRNGKTKYGFPAERKRLEKKKPFQFSRS
jgi:hypothetical protein